MAVNTDTDNWTKCSNNFNHFIYELQRAKFGPLSEMCSIWMNSSCKPEFYENKIKQLKLNNQKHKCKAKMEEMTQPFPFKCGSCSFYYS